MVLGHPAYDVETGLGEARSRALHHVGFAGLIIEREQVPLLGPGCLLRIVELGRSGHLLAQPDVFGGPGPGGQCGRDLETGVREAMKEAALGGEHHGGGEAEKIGTHAAAESRTSASRIMAAWASDQADW